MTPQLYVAWAIEALFVIFSFVFLTRSGQRPVYHWAGTLMLCLTFCWSVILGCILAFHDLTVQL